MTDGQRAAQPPSESGGFQFATVVDGLTPAGEPIVSPERGWVKDPTWRRRILRYLDSGAPVFHDASVRGPDPFDPTGSVAVPRGYRTDGTWIWSEAVEYHVERHGVAPDPGLYAMVHRYGYCETVTARTVGLARQAFERRAGADRTLGPLEPPAAAQTRFAPDVHDVLVTYGWQPGRDIDGEVDGWLDGLPAGEWTQPERAPAIHAARRILREFGGLKYPIYGPGRERDILAFWFLPRGEMPRAYELSAFEKAVGEWLFPIGTVHDWSADLLVDGRGRVFAVAEMEVLLGHDIDAALTSLVQGHRPQRFVGTRDAAG